MNPGSCPLDKIVSTGQKLDSQPITVHAFEQQFCPVHSCPLDKELSSGQLYPVF